MRLLFVALANLLLLVRTLLGLPFRLLAARDRSEYVRFVLADNPPYRERRRSPRRWFSSRRWEPGTISSLQSFREALELLAQDPRLKGILLRLESVRLPASKREELVRLLQEFRARGKRVVAWAVSVDQSGYQVMCAADEVLLAPAGELDLVGFAAEALAVAEGLGKLGVRAHFVRRGEYKTAPELFTHPYVSEIQRQTLESFLDEQYAALVEAVAQGRKRSPEEVRQWIDRGPYSARRAAQLGLVDGLCSEVELPARLGLGKPQDREGEEPPEVEPFESWRERLPWPPVRWRTLRPRPRLGLVRVSGAIYQGGGTGSFSPGAGSEALVRALREVGRDRRARALVLYVDSPGGSALASELVLEEVRRVARRKPVLAYVDQVAASGGYMVALGAKEIWSTPHAVVGSIGVFAGKLEASELLERLGVRISLLTRGANAGLGSVAHPFSEHERAALESSVEETYQAFLEHVARARGRTKEEIHALAEGRVYSGQRALAAGLVDKVGGFEQACQRALELTGKAPERFDIAIYGRPERGFSLLRLLTGALSLSGTWAFCPVAWRLRGLGSTEDL